MKAKFILLFLFCWIGNLTDDSLARATTESECTSIDLRTQFPLEMRDQGDLFWCYAHAAADYLQFYHRVPEQISATDIAVLYGQRKLPRFLRWINGETVSQTGLIKNAISDVSATGYCPEKYFPSDFWVKRYLNGKSKGLTEKVRVGTAIEDLKSISSMVRKNIFTSLSDLPFIYEFKGTSNEELFSLLSQPTLPALLNELRHSVCDPYRKKFPGEAPAMKMSIKLGDPFPRINQVLNGNLPVTVDFFYGVLENTKSYQKKTADLHTTLLIGRRFNTAKHECQYLIKDSFGTSCEGYDRELACEYGNVWVGESNLRKAIVSFEYAY